ncbi:MAG: hypothetical protein K6A44_00220 [bacterium]|nr:hypothetical protein [bacterium]
MNIDRVDFSTDKAFSGHVLPKHVKWFRKVDPCAIEDYFISRGIEANFSGKKLPAGLSFLAFDIVKRLGITEPAEFVVRKTSKDSIAQSWFLRDKKPHRFKHLAVQYDRRRYSSSLKTFDAYMRTRQYEFGSTHFLNVPMHEILHCDLFKKIGDMYAYWHTNWDKVILKKFSKIDISPFDAEIRKKIGSAGAIDAVELHAVYWAKEICMALNSNLVPKYNPFKNPKIKLSPLLRDFIERMTEADYKGAKAVSRKAKKLQKSA